MKVAFQSMGIDSALAVINALAWTAPAGVARLAEFGGIGLNTVRRVLHNLQILRIVCEAGDGLYALIDAIAPENADEQRHLLRASIQDFPLFHRVCQFLDLGESTEAALRKAAAVAGDEEMNCSEAVRLVRWGEQLGILSKISTGRYELATQIKLVERDRIGSGLLSRDLDSEMAATLFISDQLGPEAFNFLDKEERLRLIHAFLNYADDPEQSCEDAGKTLENFLRLVGGRSGVPVHDCTGITQLADRLAAKNRLVIHPHHRSLCSAVAAVRAASAHDRDRLTSVPWRKTWEMAFICGLLTLRTMKSIHAWTFESRAQTL